MAERDISARSIPGVLFVEDFDAAETSQFHPSVRETSRDDSREQSVAAEIDVQGLQSQSFQEGFEAGKRTAEDSLLSDRNKLLGRIEDHLDRACETVRLDCETGMVAVAESVFAMLHQLFPAFCQIHGENEMRAVLRSTLTGLVEEIDVLVVVHPSLSAAAREECGRLKRGVQATIEVRDDLMPGDVEVSWRHGMMARNVGKVTDSVAAALVGMGLLQGEKA